MCTDTFHTLSRQLGSRSLIFLFLVSDFYRVRLTYAFSEKLQTECVHLTLKFILAGFTTSMTQNEQLKH